MWHSLPKYSRSHPSVLYHVIESRLCLPNDHPGRCGDTADARSRSAKKASACTKAICDYIYETYGRFPGGVDAMHLMWFLQAHHLDTDYYDKFFRPGVYGAAHAAYMATWHR